MPACCLFGSRWVRQCVLGGGDRQYILGGQVRVQGLGFKPPTFP